MKRIASWLAVISIIVFIIAWGLVGLKILDNNYDFVTEAYIAYGSLAIFFPALICLRFANRCPHCGKTKQTFGKYCPYCCEKIN